MLSIDEAIAHEIEMAEGLKEQYECMMSCSEIFREQKKVFIEQCKHDSEEHEQLAEWLEELKALREEKSEFQIMAKDIAEGNYEMGMENGYNKAIDDFIHECDKHCEFYSGKNKSITREDVLKIAEQLKEMTENDRE